MSVRFLLVFADCIAGSHLSLSLSLPLSPPIVSLIYFLFPSLSLSFSSPQKHRIGDKWNHVKVEYVGFDGLFEMDLLEDEILE